MNFIARKMLLGDRANYLVGQQTDVFIDCSDVKPGPSRDGPQAGPSQTPR